MIIDTSIVIVPDIGCGDRLEVRGLKYRDPDVFVVISKETKRNINKHLDNGIVYSLVKASNYPMKDWFTGDAFIRFDLIKRRWRGFGDNSFRDRITVKLLAARESDDVLSGMRK